MPLRQVRTLWQDGHGKWPNSAYFRPVHVDSGYTTPTNCDNNNSNKNTNILTNGNTSKPTSNSKLERTKLSCTGTLQKVKRVYLWSTVLQCCREWTDFRGAYHENDSSEYSRKISSDSEFYADPSSPSWFWRKDLYASINIIWGFVGSETVKTQTELRQIILISYHNEINYQFLKSLLHRFKYFVNLCLYSVSVTDSGILCILEKIFSDYWVVTFYHFSISRWTQFNCISFLMDISLQRRKNDFLNELSLLRDF